MLGSYVASIVFTMSPSVFSAMESSKNTCSSSMSRDVFAVTNMNSPGTSLNAPYSASRRFVSGSCNKLTPFKNKQSKA